MWDKILGAGSNAAKAGLDYYCYSHSSVVTTFVVSLVIGAVAGFAIHRLLAGSKKN